MKLFFHKVSITIILFWPLRETQYAGRIKLFAEASVLFTNAVFQLIVVGKTASSECVFQGAKIGGGRSVQNRDCREDEWEECKVQTSAGEVTASVFWDSEGMLLVEY